MKRLADPKLDFNKLKKRVDIQVSILTAAITLISSFSIFLLCYRITYSDTIQNLQKRTDAIYEKVDHGLNKYTFQLISRKDDTDTNSYEEARRLLQSLRISTGAKYIYTVKVDENGQLIYVVDGLDMADEEYCCPGKLLEEQYRKEAWKAICGERAYSDKMYDTAWGKNYWAFYPAKLDGQVVGAIGIEYDTSEQYHTYQKLAIFTPIVCFICCLFAVLIAFQVFRRISNPNYRDIYNTDLLTNLKNRNAFEVDIHNMNAAGNLEGCAVVSADLNNLKKVNDAHGHTRGDQYIQCAAELLNQSAFPGAVAYRTGGDEFNVLLTGSSKEQLEQWLATSQRLLQDYEIDNKKWYSLACGYAFFDPTQDKDLLDTYKRADQEMYQNKQEQKRAIFTD